MSTRGDGRDISRTTEKKNVGVTSVDLIPAHDLLRFIRVHKNLSNGHFTFAVGANWRNSAEFVHSPCRRPHSFAQDAVVSEIMLF